MAPLVGDAAGDGDVLVARATPVGTGALAIVRLSGPAGRVLAAREGGWRRGFRRGRVPRRAYLSPFLDEDGSVVDEGLVLWFAAPASSTGEEVVELQAHGSPADRRAARLLGRERAGRGGPGRASSRDGRSRTASSTSRGPRGSAFSRRRRAGGRRGGRSVSSAESSRGRWRRSGRSSSASSWSWRRGWISPKTSRGAESGRRSRGSSPREPALLAPGAETGAGRARGAVPTVVIVGAPNAGKSTLFNALLGEDRALVTELAGTTRDAVAEVVEVAGERVRLVDTAGLRETTERLERLGVEAAGRAAAGADLLLVAREAGREAPSPGSLPAGVPVLVLATKADLPGERRDGELRVSARTGEGLAALRREIGARLASCRGSGRVRRASPAAGGAAAAPRPRSTGSGRRSRPRSRRRRCGRGCTRSERSRGRRRRRSSSTGSSPRSASENEGALGRRGGGRRARRGRGGLGRLRGSAAERSS